MHGVNAGVDQQNHAEGQHMPEALLGKKRQEIGPQRADKHTRCHGKDDAGKKTPGDDFRRSAAAGRDIKKSGNGQDGQGIAERSFDKQSDFDFATQIHLLQDGKNDRAADATERGSHKERRNPREMKRVAANERDSHSAERVAKYGKKQAAGEMAENFAKLEFEAAFEKDENQRERAKALSCAAKNIGIYPVKDGPNEHTRNHEDDDIRYAREAHKAVGHERKNEQATEQREEEIQGHRDIRRARSGEIVAEMWSRSKSKMSAEEAAARPDVPDFASSPDFQS